MSIITQAPVWLIIMCLLAGVVYAGALYFKDRFNRTYGTPLATLLGVLRFLCVSLLAFFLLKPLIRLVSYDVEKTGHRFCARQFRIDRCWQRLFIL
jgi:drug/metabolite transporter (DMT)-like permease